MNLPAIVLGTVLAVASPLALAQAPGGGVTSVLEGVQAALRALTATVSQLATSVNQLMAAHAAGPTTVVKLTTSAAHAGGNATTCNAFNTGAAPLQVNLRMMAGGVIQAQSFVTVYPEAGVALAPTGAALTPVHCEFISSNNVSLLPLRANMVMHSLTGTPLLLAEAR